MLIPIKKGVNDSMLKQLGRWIANLDNIFASISLILIISVSVIGVFMRFIVGEPLTWTEEMTLALFVWFTFLGASVVEKENGHVGIDYFVEKLNPSFKRFALLGKELIVGFINIFVFVFLGSQLTAQAASRLTPVLRISYIYIDIAVVLGGLFAATHIILRIRKILKKTQALHTVRKIEDYQTTTQEEAKI